MSQYLEKFAAPQMLESTSPDEKFAEIGKSDLSRSERNQGIILLSGESVDIPNRLYQGWGRPEDSGLSGTEQIMVACLLTRFHDGYLRERWLHYLLTVITWWAVPYVLMLLGEYVPPIGMIIHDHYERMDPRSDEARTVVRLCEDNPGFIQLLERRCISYWNVYYREEYPHKDSYPSLCTVRYLNSLTV